VRRDEHDYRCFHALATAEGRWVSREVSSCIHRPARKEAGLRDDRTNKPRRRCSAVIAERVVAIIRSGIPGDAEWEIYFGDAEMDDRVLGPDDLGHIRAQVESMDNIVAVSPAVRAIVMHYWPDLATKLPPEDEELHLVQNAPELNPGDPRAIALGCTCDPAANQNGRGSMLPDGRGPVYRADSECPMHGLDAIAALLNEDDGDDAPPARPH
jgi:hypothetical protein